LFAGFRVVTARKEHVTTMESVPNHHRPQPVSEEAFDRANRLAQGLFPHQVEGLAFLLQRRRAILADDMGLGKTRQAIAAASQSAETGPCLVVCPASVKQNWEREIAAIAPSAPVRLLSGAPQPGQAGRLDTLRPGAWVIVNYDILAA
jgi:SNF2 family DNA or RNA helicase